MPIQRILCAVIMCLLPFTYSHVSAQQDAAVKEPTSKAEDSIIRKSQKLYKSEIKPLQQKQNEMSSRLNTRVSSEAQLIQRLESADETALEKVRKEIDQLSSRLKLLERIEDVLVDMDSDAIETAIEEAKKKQIELREQRRELARPIQIEMADVQAQYAKQNPDLAKAVDIAFREKGEGEFKDLSRTQSHANFAHSMYSSTYGNEKEKSQIAISIHFSHFLNVGTRKFELWDGKYKIYQQADNHIILLVNGMQVGIYDIKKKFGKEKLNRIIKQFVDFEKLAALND